VLGASRAMMVLLPLQVHLQNDVREAARDREREDRKVRRRKSRYGGFRILVVTRIDIVLSLYKRRINCSANKMSI